MNNRHSKSPQGKDVSADRQKRLSAALRKNLYKRKSQNQERQKEKEEGAHDVDSQSQKD